MYHLGKFAIAAVSAVAAVLAGIGTGDSAARYADTQQVAVRGAPIVFPVSTVSVSKQPRATKATTTTTTTTTTTVAPVEPYRGADQMCPQWHQTALQAGWAPEHLPKLSYIMWRESRCLPAAHNTKDPTPDGSRGLVQINGYWCRSNRYNPGGFLQAHGVLGICADLHDPATNLKAALVIWQYGRDLGRSGWGPWAV